MRKLNSGGFSEEKMRVAFGVLLFSLGAFALGTTRDSTMARGGSGIKIGNSDRGGSRGGNLGTGRVGSGVRIGDSRVHNGTVRQRTVQPTPTTPIPLPFTTSPIAAAAANPITTTTISDLRVSIFDSLKISRRISLC